MLVPFVVKKPVTIYVFFPLTGSEAMFADLGHFTSASVRVS